MTSVGHKGSVHKDMTLSVRILQVISDHCLLLLLITGTGQQIILHLISPSHVMEELIFILQHPDPEDTVLTSRGQQSTTQRELHAPYWTLMVTRQVLTKLNILEVCGSRLVGLDAFKALVIGCIANNLHAISVGDVSRQSSKLLLLLLFFVLVKREEELRSNLFYLMVLLLMVKG